MSKQPESIIDKKPFDIQEAVVLLDVYLLEKHDHLKRIEAARIASHKLRDLAARRGMTVSESFRSSTGLQNRLRSIGNLFEGKESVSAPGTAAFRKAIAMYNDDRQKYQQILRDACSNAPQNAHKQSGSKAPRILRTKFVRTKRDQALKDKYSSGFNDVFYTLKRMSEKNDVGVTSTEIFLELDRRIKRKDISEILDGVSWSKSIKAGRYVFYDKDQEERKRRQMDEALRNAEKEFYAWLPSAVPPQTVDEIKNSSKIISAMLMQKRILAQDLVVTTQIGQIENALRQVKATFGSKKMRNSATRLLTLYVAYLREKKNPESVINIPSEIEVGEDWIRFDFSNAQSFERTVPVYCNINGSEIEGRNWARLLVAIVEHELANENPALDELYKKTLYANKTNRPFFMKEKIEGHNCAKLSNGYWVNINWSIPRLMEIIQAFCLHCGYSKNQVMLYGIPRGSASAKRGNSPEKRATNRSIDMEKAEVFLKNAGLHGSTVQELIDALQPGLAFWPVKNALDENQRVIAMPENRYVHVDLFDELDEAEEGLGRILRTHFAQFGGYSNNQLLFGAASQELSMFLNDYDCENIDAVYDIARYLFEKKACAGKPYKFFPPHIFEVEPDYPLNLRGLMIHLARNNGGILHSADAKSFLQKTMLTYGGLGQLLQIGTASTFLMYDDDRYLLSEVLGIDDGWCHRMHDRMDDLFRKANVAYVIPRDISTTWLNTLPALPQNLEWTLLLLQEVLDKYPAIGFKSISADVNQSHHTLSAAFVPIGSPLQSFPDVVALFMEGRHELPKRMLGEELRLELRNAGMLENDELIYALPKALDDYRFAWSDENKYVYVRGNK